MNRPNLRFIRTAVGSTAFLASALVGVAAIAGLPGCACPGTNPASVDKAGSIVKKDGGYYAVESHDGRTYVFGDEETHAGWRKTREMRYSKSLIGAGPKGETVVFEIRDKLPELEERLMARFASENGMAR